MFGKILIVFLRSAIAYAIYLAVVLSMTGALERKHEVLSENASVNIHQQTFLVDELAKQYVPKISENEHSKLLKQIWYEIVEQPDYYAITYYFEFSEKINPNLVFNFLENLARLFYYDFTLKDITFIQVNISKSEGKILKVWYVSEENQNLVFKQIDNTLNFLVGSWQHNFVPNPNSENHLNLKVNYLAKQDFKNAKFSRRLQGDFKTEESIANLIIMVFVGCIALFYFVVVQWDYINRPKS